VTACDCIDQWNRNVDEVVLRMKVLLAQVLKPGSIPVSIPCKGPRKRERPSPQESTTPSVRTAPVLGVFSHASPGVPLYTTADLILKSGSHVVIPGSIPVQGPPRGRGRPPRDSNSPYVRTSSSFSRGSSPAQSSAAGPVYTEDDCKVNLDYESLSTRDNAWYDVDKFVGRRINAQGQMVGLYVAVFGFWTPS
jgi:hypothetical protein